MPSFCLLFKSQSDQGVNRHELVNRYSLVSFFGLCCKSDTISVSITEACWFLIVYFCLPDAECISCNFGSFTIPFFVLYHKTLLNEETGKWESNGRQRKIEIQY